MESLPIIPIAHSSYIGSTGDWDIKTRKGASDFGCLKDKWAIFECKKQIKFFDFMSGVKPKVSKLLRRHLNGESDGREDIEAPIMRDPVLEWERRILCTVERLCAAQISERMQNT
jgi:hypothetical protein